MSDPGVGSARSGRNLIERSTHDEAFRRNLLADPRGTIERETGARLPEGVELRVVEESPNILYLVLPPRGFTPQEGDSLSERELGQVSGGFGTADLSPWGCRFELTQSQSC